MRIEQVMPLLDTFERAVVVRIDASGKRFINLRLSGMPRVQPLHEKCVFFLRSDVTDEIVGTGFLVTRGGSLYGITNHHVAQLGAGRTLSINKKDSGTRAIKTEEEDWVDLPEEDLSAIDLTDKISEDDDILAICETDLLTKDDIEHLAMRMGEDVFLVGLFTNHHKQADRNIASGRFGCISMMASQGTNLTYYANRRQYNHESSFVADFRSRPGYSGSPVFVYRIIDLSGFSKGDYYFGGGGAYADPSNSPFIKLLGVHCAQFDDTVTVSKKSPSLAGHSLLIPGAMTIVVPAWSIIKLLDDAKFQSIRADRELDRRGRFAQGE